MIKLKHCTVERTDFGVTTRFLDGTETSNWPPDTDHFRWCAEQCGFGDVKAYCYNHDLLHSLISEILFDRPSPTLWAAAHGEQFDGTYEEHVVWQFQLDPYAVTWPRELKETYYQILANKRATK